MKRPWRRRRRDEMGRTDADRALEISENQRERAVARSREFQAKAARWRRMREVNHLAEAFERAFGGGR